MARPPPLVPCYPPPTECEFNFNLPRRVRVQVIEISCQLGAGKLVLSALSQSLDSSLIDPLSSAVSLGDRTVNQSFTFTFLPLASHETHAMRLPPYCPTRQIKPHLV